jgi:chromate transporter
MSDGTAATANEAGKAGDSPQVKGSVLEVLGVSTRLGLTSFGGPVAHLGYFREEYVRRRRWISEDAYADLVVLCQFLPGPTSSQVGVAIGILRAGLPGAVASWLGFSHQKRLLRCR